MNTTLNAPKPFDLCTEIATEADPFRRNEALAYMRGEIARELQTQHSPQDQVYLRISEMILDFLEERFASHPCDIGNQVSL